MGSDVFLYILALEGAAGVVSPTHLGIAYADRRDSVDFWINILLDFLGWIPGVIHAWYIISHTEGVAR
ncbi:hypothetical protein CVT26_007040 [Gymnopilus dilepis]|uniref:Uncharacterized protein n=1 Tax=Gymnopilus dilepis TaxID=231916 RepID=A0A409VNC8_9AGAR|nr:hypothetical protein CVT26_007040 [Gymnopilus dilepis]